MTREPWWRWHWDKVDVGAGSLPFLRVTRWRRGSLLTVYRVDFASDVQWWVLLPFNIGVCASFPIDREEMG